MKQFAGLLLLLVSAFVLWRGDVAPIDPIDPVDPVNPVVPDDPDWKYGKNVLIVYQSEDESTYPPEQASILTSAIVREFLTSKCGQDGWRILDADTDPQYMGEIWQTWLARPRDSLPWVLISNGETGTEGLLPANRAAFEELVNGVIK